MLFTYFSLGLLSFVLSLSPRFKVESKMVNITVIIAIFIFISSSFYTCLIPRDALVKNPPTNSGKCGCSPWVGKIPCRRKEPSTLVLLPGESSWTEEPGRLQPMGSQRVGYDWTHTHKHTFHTCLWKIKTLFSLWKMCYVPHNRLLKCVQNYLFLAPSDRTELSPLSNPAERCFLAWAFCLEQTSSV